MPWSITRDGPKYCVTKQGEDSPLKCYDNRTDAIKYQRALYANESRASVVAALTYEEPVEAPDTRLEEALARLDEIAAKEASKEHLQVTVKSADHEVTEALIATLDQISERLLNGERVSESLIASLHAMAAQPAPIVNVAPTEVHIPETVVNVPAPVVNVEAPVVNIPETVVNVPAPNVTVNMPEASKEKKVTFTRDPFGKLEGAEITEE